MKTKVFLGAHAAGSDRFSCSLATCRMLRRVEPVWQSSVISTHYGRRHRSRESGSVLVYNRRIMFPLVPSLALREALFRASRAAFLAAAVAATGCVSPSVTSTGNDDPGLMNDAGAAPGDVVDIDENNFSESLVLSTVKNGRYTEGGFVKLTSSPYPSPVAPGFYIDVWVSNNAVSQFLLVDPETDGSDAYLPVGSVIVREVLTPEGELAKITMMAKGPEGYYPRSGDYWYGVTDPNGEVLYDGDERMAGALDQCGGCHAARRGLNDDYLFGIPLDHR